MCKFKLVLGSICKNKTNVTPQQQQQKKISVSIGNK